MPAPTLDQLRKRFASAIEGTDFASDADTILSLTEGYVLLDAPPDERDPEFPTDALSRPVPEYEKILQAARERRERKMLERLAIGATRFGGLPDLPPNFPWPQRNDRKIPFVTQIDLADLPRWEGSPLPAEGWLYYFALYGPGYEGVSLLHYHAGPRAALVRAPLPAREEIHGMERQRSTVYSVQPLVARLGLTIDPARLSAALPDVADNISFELEELLEELNEPPLPRFKTVGWLLGNMSDVDGTPAEAAHSTDSSDDWIHLLAIRTRRIIAMGDVMLIYLLVRRADLSARNFGDAIVHFGCS
jgi:hypothetical protein